MGKWKVKKEFNRYKVSRRKGLFGCEYPLFTTDRFSPEFWNKDDAQYFATRLNTGDKYIQPKKLTSRVVSEFVNDSVNDSVKVLYTIQFSSIYSNFYGFRGCRTFCLSGKIALIKDVDLAHTISNMIEDVYKFELCKNSIYELIYENLDKIILE